MSEASARHQWQVYSTPAQAAQAVAEAIAATIRSTTEGGGLCRIALPGGNTPAYCLDLLAAMDLPWAQVHWYLGDERCLPIGDSARNDSMIEAHLWSKIQAAPANRHPIHAERGAEQAAGDYAQDIVAAGTLDLVLMGMGEDGHTASLFPDNPALADERPVAPVFNAPKPPPERVSLSRTTLQAARRRLVLATGAGKHSAIEQVRNGADLPINRIGVLEWYVDEAAVDEAAVG